MEKGIVSDVALQNAVKEAFASGNSPSADSKQDHKEVHPDVQFVQDFEDIDNDRSYGCGGC